MDKLIEWVFKQIHLAEEDALVAAFFAALGFSVDAYFFPIGIPSSTVAGLAGAVGLLLSRLLKNRRFFIERSLKRIDELVAQERLTLDQGKLLQTKNH